MDNITVSQVNAKFDSFIQLRTGAVLSINNSVFSDVSCYEEGAVLFAGTEQTSTQIQNTVFENNAALLGGVMYIEQQSVVQ